MSTRFTRRSFLAVAGTAALAGCAGVGSRVSGREGRTTPRSADTTGGNDPSGSSTGGGTGTPAITATPGGGAPPIADRRFPLPLPPEKLRNRVVSGGQPKDGIPSIDEPKSVSAAKADGWLDPESIVFGVRRNGEAKAYPQSILVWHEICNDVVGGDPVSVTYCPLTGTAIGFERGETTFGVSGRLVNNNLIMYDRRTQHWWPQVLSTSIPTPWNPNYATRSLRDFRVIWTTWERWRSAHPDTTVLSKETGYLRNYGADPYGSYVPRRSGYYARGSSPMFGTLNHDDRYEPKRVVMGARTPEGAIAFLKDALRERKLVPGALAGTPHLGVYDPTLDTAYVYRNPDGATFEFGDGKVVAGDGTAHEPDALPLSRVHAFDAMWFAWIGFYPDSAVHE